MKIIKKSILVIVILFSSCQLFENKSSYLNDFEKFVANTSANYKNYSQNDWENADSTFIKFNEIDYKKWETELNKKEKEKLSVLKGKYEAIKLKSGFNSIKSEIENILDETKSFLKELLTDSINKK